VAKPVANLGGGGAVFQLFGRARSLCDRLSTVAQLAFPFKKSWIRHWAKRSTSQDTEVSLQYNYEQLF